jgi:hypothetical protein
MQVSFPEQPMLIKFIAVPGGASEQDSNHTGFCLRRIYSKSPAQSKKKQGMLLAGRWAQPGIQPQDALGKRTGRVPGAPGLMQRRICSVPWQGHGETAQDWVQENWSCLKLPVSASLGLSFPVQFEELSDSAMPLLSNETIGPSIQQVRMVGEMGGVGG